MTLPSFRSERAPAGIAVLTAALVTLDAGAALGWQVPQIVTQVQHAARDLTIYANGIPVADASGETASHIFQISSYLQDGENVIRFEWTRTGPAGRPFSAVVQVNRQPEGLTDIAVIAPIADDPVGQTTSRELTIEVDLPRPWAWTDAPAVALDTAERDAILAALRELHGAYAAGDAAGAASLTNLMWTELAGFRDALVEQVLVRYEELMDTPDWAVAPLPEASLDLEAFGPLVRVLADRPLIEQIGPDGKGPVLRIRGLFFARIDDRWVPVRPVN